jgi:hypothetical protein
MCSFLGEKQQQQHYQATFLLFFASNKYTGSKASWSRFPINVESNSACAPLNHYYGSR